MSKLNIPHTRDLLQKFDFDTLFIEELNWSRPTNRKAEDRDIAGIDISCRQVAMLAGVVVLEIASSDGKIPDAKSRKVIHKEISKSYHENLLIFIDKDKTQSLWYWVKREERKAYPREHSYFRGQPGDLFITKLSGIVFDISDFEKTGDVSVVEVARRLKNALDVERVTKKFYGEFQEQHLEFIELIKGISDEQQRHWYASVLLNRLMFIYFLQKKGFVDNGDLDYLQNKLKSVKAKGKDLYYSDFLKPLFFEGFAKPENQRSSQAAKILGKIKYLNGGLFLLHPVEEANPRISIPDKAFENLFGLFQRYSWNLNDTPGGEDNEINPDVLGYIFEKYINQKAFGAYYTRPEITEYLCERTIQHLVLDKVNSSGNPRQFDSIGDVLLNLDANLCKLLFFEVLPKLSILDPACGSGAFLVAAMKTLINIYSALIGKMEFMTDQGLTAELKKIKSKHPSIGYFIKKRIITDNLFGVDIMQEAIEVAKLRLFLALVAAANRVDDLEPLPNIDFNIQSGNSLIGLIRVDALAFEATLGEMKQKRLVMKYEGSKDELGFTVETTVAPSKKEKMTEYFAEVSQRKYSKVLEAKNKMIDTYRHADADSDDLLMLRNQITAQKQPAIENLNSILLDEFRGLEIKYEQATWDSGKGAEGKPIRRSLTVEDIEALKPFHWGFEFDEIINQRGGFDAIITNPPWEIFKPNSKEFFEEYSDLVTKKKMTIHEFEKEQAKLLRDPEMSKAWLGYLSEYPHVSAFYRSAPHFKNQISIIDGKKAGSDLNLYKLFTEQCFNLLRDGGQCGIVIPSGIYTDLGAKQLREMLFGKSKITGLFCFENSKAIFEGVHRSFKFVVLTFERGDITKSFPAAFMRHEVSELERFPQEGAISISENLIRRLSPDSFSLMEFKDPLDITIAEKLLQFSMLGEAIPGKWNLKLTAEFHMTNDSHLFKNQLSKGRLPLYEGKMIHQFRHDLASPRYWVAEKDGRAALLKRGVTDKGQELTYQNYRLGFRDVARNTDERTMIASVIPKNVFAGNTLITSTSPSSAAELLVVVGLLNSIPFDFFIRLKVTAHCNMFYVYQIPVPRLTEKDKIFKDIERRVARLICTTAEFDTLAKEAGLKGWRDGVTDQTERLKIRAELDGMIAHLYGLTDEELTHILSTFPIVPQSIKDATLEAYRKLAKTATTKPGACNA